MGICKYSPTVTKSYMVDRCWFDKAPKHPEKCYMDADGYDSYGYKDGDGPDRAGYTETDYMVTWDDYEESGMVDYYLYDRIAREWANKVITFDQKVAA